MRALRPVGLWAKVVGRGPFLSIELSLISPFMGWGWAILGPDLVGKTGLSEEVGAIVWIGGMMLCSMIPPAAVVLAHLGFAREEGQPIHWATVTALLLAYLATIFMLASWGLLISTRDMTFLMD